MSLEYFRFPENYKSIEINQQDGSFFVGSNFQILRMSNKEVHDKLNKIQKNLEKDFTYIKDQDVFGFLYNLITHFEDKKKDLIYICLSQVSNILELTLEKIIKEINSENYEPKTCYKMVCFLIFYFFNQSKFKLSKNNLEEIGKDKKTKQITHENINQFQKSILKILTQSLKINLIKQWQNHATDYDFFKYMLNMLLNTLENSNCLSDQQYFDNLIFCLSVSLECKKIDLKPQVLKLKFILIENEDSLHNLIQFLIKAYDSDSFQLRNLVIETIKLLVTTMSIKRNMAGDSMPFKNTKEILQQLSEKLPRFFNSQLSYFTCLYDSESYLLRNALNEILGNIIRLVLTKSSFSQDNDNQEQNKQNKIKLLKLLFKRFHDKNSYARSNVLQVFTQLAQENALPFEYLQLTLDYSCQRIQDISTVVRKNALKCVQVLVKIYFAIFAESQQQLKFLTSDQILNQMDQMQIELEKCQDRIVQNEQVIQTLNENQENEFDSLISEQNELKRSKDDIVNAKKKMEEYLSFIQKVDSIIPIIQQLLGSKSIFDSTEAIKMFMVLNKYNIQKSDLGVKKMLSLIWSKEKSIKEEVVQSYYNIYFNSQEFSPAQIAQNLIKIMIDCNLNDITSLEELISIMHQDNGDNKFKLLKLSPDVFKELWNTFMKTLKDSDEIKIRKSCIQLIRIISSKNKDYLVGKFEIIIAIISQNFNSKRPDFFLIKEFCKIAENLNHQNQPRFKDLIKSLINIMLKFQGTDDSNWYCALEQLISALYNLDFSFEITSEFILKELSKFLNVQSVDYEQKLSQLIFAIGQIAIKFLLIMDDLEGLVKKIKNEQSNKNDEINELDMVDGGQEAEFDKRQKLIQEISEQYIVNKNLISQYQNLIIGVCRQVKLNDFKNSLLARSAILTMTKLMIISPDFCKQQIQFVLEFLNHENIDSTIKHNIIVVLGDLLHRHPNIIQPYISYIYLGLKDKDKMVRKTCLMVITHLILNDMLKATAEISDLAKLFEDEDQNVRELVQLFFCELHKKDNKAIYNLLTEFLSRLSKDGIDEDQFQSLAKNIIQYLDKDKQQDSMIEKLCQRFKFVENQKELHNTSFCLTLLNYQEKGVRKLLDCFDAYRNSLSDEIIFDNFYSILKKLRKTQKQDLKVLIEEWENKLDNFEREGINENSRKKKKIEKKINQKTQQKKKQKKAVQESEDEKEMSIEEESVSEPQVVQRKTRASAQRNN